MPQSRTRHRDFFLEVVDGLLARPGAVTRLVVVMQFVLIAVWNTVALVSSTELIHTVADIVHEVDDFFGLNWYWWNPYEFSHEIIVVGMGNPLQFFVFAPLAFLTQFAVAFVPFRLLNRRLENPYPAFMRSWYRTCLWGTVALIPGLVLCSLLYEFDDWFFWLPSAAFFAVIPAVLHHSEIRPRWRMVRWRPECPECGYALRRLVEARCPECGVAFPTTKRVYRRWAFRRIMWDRVRRDSFLMAYIKTMLTIVFCPCRAARGLVIPDRWGRAWRWAGVHLLVSAIACALAGSSFGFIQVLEIWWLERQGNTFWNQSSLKCYSGWDVLIWFAQSFLAWLVVLAVIPVVGVVAIRFSPIRNRLAEAVATKASLYLVGILFWYILGAELVTLVKSPASPAFFFGWQRWVMTPPSMLILAVVYGFWWSCVTAWHPCRSHRGIKSLLLYWAFFVGLWALIARIVFDPGQLRWVL